ncbi:ketoacyl-synt-domain-containing protein [Patellaria atrata CBS 101060]|uniref:Ketoacyl-synt-domain-containing protein n=1 Tax=Patellaria atrata CBS 101060 TaxID=1346257 RepID=A0A9P4SDT5_9PEZI|nr:ketoacyl-synt-domain-containing protein [Patellaria atrata CBS 101060]
MAMANTDKQEPIAIIGAACRLPGEVSSLGNLWDMVSHEKTGHCKVPADRWDADVWHHPDADRKGSIAVKHGYFLKQDISQFDAPFFSTTAKEAASMDPMKRLLLEVSYESIENAGIPVERLMNSQTGCYVGCMTNDYEMMSLHDIYDVGHVAASATSEAMIANRVSWFFGMKGPSLTLDTACSSSLYALHLACQSLKLKESEMALVAGVNLIINPNTMHQLSAMHMLSPEGISHTFDDRANGYGRGEGIGCLVVKRLSDALRDGDTIRAVIRGTGANADGKTPSITQPSSLAQAELINTTYEAAGLSQSSTQYFESHGTGTPVGDPIELSAIASTLGASRSAAGMGPLYVGSIKPSVGHTEGCSGLAGVFKALVCLEKGMLVPTYGVERINPKLKLSEWNIALPPTRMKWPTKGQRRVSINSFGFGGANAHAILDDAYHYLAERSLEGNHNTIVDEDDGSDSGVSVGPGTPMPECTQNSKRLFVFSTKDQAGIQRVAASYADSIAKSCMDNGDPRYLSNLAYTLSTRRSHFDFRSFSVASTAEELTMTLSKGLPKIKRSSRQDSNLFFVFTGQGAQWPAMGRQLLNNPVFETSIHASQRYLEKLGCKWDAFQELKKTDDSNISLPEYSQTLCTVLQVALVDLLRHWKVTPRATVGHSSGEIAAAYAASYITHADAIKIAYVRGLSSATVTRQGAMLAAGLSQNQALEYLGRVPHESAVVACVNSPSSVTLSGDVEAIDTLEKLISGDGKFARKLKVKTAYHSPHMRAVADGYYERMGQISPVTDTDTDGEGNKTVMFSSLTGKIVSPEELSAQYWVSNMCAPVEFSSAVAALVAHTTQSTSSRKKTPIRWGGIVELGPHAALQGPVQQIITASTNKTAKDAVYTSMIMRGKDANETALAAAGQLWALGYDIDLSAVNSRDGERAALKALADLPAYPWNHSKGFWHEAYITRSNRFPSKSRTDLLGVAEDLQNSAEPRWRNHLRISENPWIEDHQITGTILYPGAGMLVMALEGALQTADPEKQVKGFRFRDIAFMRGLVVTSGDETAVETRLSLQPHKTIPGQFQFTIYSTTTGTSWTKHCNGNIALEYVATSVSEVEDTMIDAEWAQQSELYKRITADSSAEDVDIETFYDHLETIGMEYGPLFRNVVSLTAIPSMHAAHATIIIPDTKSVMPENYEYPHIMHPATMDAIFHPLLAAFNDGKPIEEAAVPFSIEDMYVAADQPHGAGEHFLAYGQQAAKRGGGREIVGDLVVSDNAWSSPKLTIKGFALRQVTSAENADSIATEGFEAIKKCVRVEWKEDVDFIKTGDDVARLREANGSETPHILGQLSLWLDRLAHKKAVRKALLVIDNDSQSPAAREIIRSILHPTCLLDIWNTTQEETPAVTDNSYDVIISVGSRTQESNNDTLVKLQKALSSSGHLVILQSEEEIGDVKSTLQSAGFANTTTFSANSSSNFLIASNNSAVSVKPPSEIYVLLPSSISSAISTLLNTLISLLSDSNVTVRPISFSATSTPDLSGKYVVSLLEVESPLIYSWDESQFTLFKSLVSSAKHLFWVTHGGLLQSWSNGVEFAPAQGLLRVLRNEYPLITLPHLDLSAGFDLNNTENGKLVLDIWQASLVEGAEMEYAELHGAVFVPRAVEDSGFDGELQLADGSAKPVYRSIQGSEVALKIASSTCGGDFLWVTDEGSTSPLDSKDVEVQVEFVGLNASDVVNADDNTSESPQLGHEAVGIVTRCGEQVKSVSVGQRVAVYQGNALKTHIRQNEALVAALPATVLPSEAAGLSCTFIAAQYALLEVARLSRGQTVLLHSAASGLGQAALQVAQFVGADIFALASTKEEKDILVERYGMSPGHIFDPALRNFVTAISLATNGRGVDAILCQKSSPAVVPSLRVLGEFGYFLDLSSDSSNAPQLNLPSSKRNASLVRIDMDRVSKAKPDVINELFQRTFSVFLRTGTIGPIAPTNVISVSNTMQALDILRAQDFGKIVLSLDKNSLVLMPALPAPKLALEKEATYVLAGGLGALGLDIANMMIDNGAGHLVFLSRSGGSKNEKELTDFRSRGVKADAFKCDVNDSQSVANVFEQLRSEGCVVKGLVQCAMVLEDTIFDNMTHAKWSRAILPKTHGSRNLLAHLSPPDSPFFILLSSITGIIGNTAQANYASGNTFEDALAHYARAHLSIPATSIDVGLVSDSSHFTSAGEFGDLDNYLHRYQHGWKGLQTSLDELRVVLEAVMRGSTSNGQEVPAQLVLGLGDNLVREEGSTGFQKDRKFELRVTTADAGASEGCGKGVSVGEMLSKATTVAEASAAVEDNMKAQIALAIGVEVEEVDGQKPLFDFGVDSLKAVEIRNRVLKEMQSDVSVFELLSATPMAELAAKIATRSALVKLNASEDV